MSSEKAAVIHLTLISASHPYLTGEGALICFRTENFHSAATKHERWQLSLNVS